MPSPPPSTASPARRRFLFGLLQRRECVVPTWRGLFTFAALAGLTLFLFVRNIYPFLAITEPHPGGTLVIEGWASDFAMAQAIEEFRSHPYDVFLVTGGPIDKGAPFSEFKTFAEFGEATLERMGVAADRVHSVPAPLVEKDRTYAAGLALKAWLEERQLPVKNVNILSMGCHARRSRLLYEKAFGPGTRIGITALEDPFAPKRPWWVTSVGVRGVINETMAYTYALLFFNPDRI